MTPDEWLLEQFDNSAPYVWGTRGNFARQMIQIIDCDPGGAYTWCAGDLDPYEEVITCQRPTRAAPAAATYSPSSAKAS